MGKGLDGAIDFLEKELGKNIIMDLKGVADMKTPHIKTGIIPVDIISGIGGFPLGGIVEVYGLESSGKTTFVLQGPVKSLMKSGGSVLYLDYEHAFDAGYVRDVLGVDVEDREHFLVSQPETFEDGGTIVRKLASEGLISMVVWDSLAASVPSIELDPNKTDMGEGKMGAQSRVCAQILKQVTGIIDKSQTNLTFINQLRAKIGATGSYYTTPGGLALKFYAKQRYEFIKKEGIKGRYLSEVTQERMEGVVGTRVRIKCAKNKCAAPFKECDILMKEGKGFDMFGTALELAVKQGKVAVEGKSRDLFTFGGVQARGEDEFLASLLKEKKLNDLYTQLGWGDYL